MKNTKAIAQKGGPYTIVWKARSFKPQREKKKGLLEGGGKGDNVIINLSGGRATRKKEREN